ncbi:hypothetical protein JXA88_17055 [Candidatus Fermentibacteria bacterium]|nr:hypothetical protein [Candidatus Fermentibacteria bacterium]
MKDQKDLRSREIMTQIHDVLWFDWDPIGTRELGGPDDEYDFYIGGVYRLLASGTTKQDLADHLRGIQADSMGMSIVNEENLNAVVDKLLKLDVSLKVG